MPFVVIHDRPDLMMPIAQRIGNYRANDDAYRRDFAERQFGAEQARRDRELDWHQQQFTLTQAQHLHDQILAQEAQQRAYEQQNQLENLRTQNDLAQADLQRAFQAGKQEDDQKFRAGEADKKRGFDTVKGIGGAIEKGIAGVWNTITGNTPAARQAEITKREQMRAARSDTWRQLQQQNRLDDQKRKIIEDDFQQDVTAAHFRAEKAMGDARSMPTEENKAAAAEAMREYDSAIGRLHEFRLGTTNHPSPQPATQPTGSLFGPATPAEAQGGYLPAPGAGMADAKQADVLDQATAAQFLQLAKGDKNLARDLARRAGYRF